MRSKRELLEFWECERNHWEKAEVTVEVREGDGEARRGVNGGRGVEEKVFDKMPKRGEDKRLRRRRDLDKWDMVVDWIWWCYQISNHRIQEIGSSIAALTTAYALRGFGAAKKEV